MMPTSNAAAWELLQDGIKTPVVCDYCGETLWSDDAEWVGYTPMHPDCETERANELLGDIHDELFPEDSE